MACFSYIEGWYNPVRLHSGLGRAYAKRLASSRAKVGRHLDSFGGIAGFALPRGFDLYQ